VVELADAPAATVDTYGGLLREGETPEQALLRLEKRRNYAKAIGTDEGQRLLAAATAEEDPFAIVCVGSNHVPGHSRGCPRFRPASAAPEPGTYVPTVGQLAWIPTGDIDIGPNVRVDPGELDELATNIQELGILQPVKVRQAGDRWILIWGQRRVLAARMVGLATVPALIEVDEKTAAKVSIEQLSENLQKKDLNPIEEAVAMRAVLDGTKGLTQVALARQLGRSEPWIASTLALLKAPAEVQELVRSDTLSIAHAKAIAGLPAADQVRLAKSAASNGVSAHSLEDTAKWERSRQSDTKERSGLAAKAAAQGLVALDKAKTPKDVPLYVFASDWRIQDADVRKVIREAGYQVVDGWTRSGNQRWSKCDCTAISLQIRDGDGSIVEPACTSDAHWNALKKAADADRLEKEKTADADRKRLASFVRAAMPAEFNPTVARLMLKVLDGYSGKTWAEYAKLSDASLTRAIADRLTSEQALRGSTYNGDNKAIPIKTLLRELGGLEENTPAAPAKHPRRRSPESVKVAADA
jgi:ParB family chromosome partitioning protein